MAWVAFPHDSIGSVKLDPYQIKSKVRKVWLDLLDLGPSASQSSDGDASAASRILVISFLQVCLFWATDLKCSRSFRLVSCSLWSDTRVRSLLRTTGSVVKGWPLNLLPCDIK